MVRAASLNNGESTSRLFKMIFFSAKIFLYLLPFFPIQYSSRGGNNEHVGEGRLGWLL